MNSETAALVIDRILPAVERQRFDCDGCAVNLGTGFVDFYWVCGDCRLRILRALERERGL